MRLIELLGSLLSKADMPSLFARPDAPARKRSFDERKAHLHKETRVDRTGKRSTRWVKNAEAPKQEMPTLLQIAQNAQQQTRKPTGMPALFDVPGQQYSPSAPKQLAQRPTPKPKEAMPALLSVPKKTEEEHEDEARTLPPKTVFQLGNRDTDPVTVLPDGRITFHYHGLRVPYVMSRVPGTNTWEQLEHYPDGSVERHTINQYGRNLTWIDTETVTPTPHVPMDAEAHGWLRKFADPDSPHSSLDTPKPVMQALISNGLAHFVYAPGSNGRSQHYRLRLTEKGQQELTREAPKAPEAPKDGLFAAKVGDTKTEDGITYRLNDNHRWERVEDETPKPEAPTQAAEPVTIRNPVHDTLHATVTQPDGSIKVTEGAGAGFVLHPTGTNDEYTFTSKGDLITYRMKGRVLEFVSRTPIHDEKPAQQPAEDTQHKARLLMMAWASKKTHPVPSTDKTAVMQAFKLSLDTGQPAYVTTGTPAQVTSEKPATDQGLRFTVNAADGSAKYNVMQHITPAAPDPEPASTPEAAAQPKHPYHEAVRVTGHGVTATIQFNAQHNGIEVKFSSKPGAGILATLDGFRWSRRQGLWYAADSSRTRASAAALEKALKPAEVVAPAPVHEPASPTDAPTPTPDVPLADTTRPYWVDGHLSKPAWEQGYHGTGVYARGTRGMHAKNGPDQLLLVEPHARLLQMPKGEYLGYREVLSVIIGPEAAKQEDDAQRAKGFYPSMKKALMDHGFDGVVTAAGNLTLINPKMARGVQHPQESPEERAAVMAFAKLPKPDRESAQKFVDEGEGRLDRGRGYATGGRGPKFGDRIWSKFRGTPLVTGPVRIEYADVFFPTGALMRALTGRDRIPVGPNVMDAMRKGIFKLGDRREFGNGEVYELGKEYWTRVDALEVTAATTVKHPTQMKIGERMTGLTPNAQGQLIVEGTNGYLLTPTSNGEYTLSSSNGTPKYKTWRDNNGTLVPVEDSERQDPGTVQVPLTGDGAQDQSPASAAPVFTTAERLEVHKQKVFDLAASDPDTPKALRMLQNPEEEATGRVVLDGILRKHSKELAYQGTASSEQLGDHEELRRTIDAISEEFSQQHGPAPLPSIPGLPEKRDTPVEFTDSPALAPDEARAVESGTLHVGSIKTENGVTYRLNDNHRWERVQDLGAGRYRLENGTIVKPKGEPATDGTHDLPTRILTATGKVLDTFIPDGEGGLRSKDGMADSRLKPEPSDPTLWRTHSASTPMWFRRVGDELRYLASSDTAPGPDVVPADIHGHREAIYAAAREDGTIHDAVAGAHNNNHALHTIDDRLFTLSLERARQTGDMAAHKAFSAHDHTKEYLKIAQHHKDLVAAGAEPHLAQALKDLLDLAQSDPKVAGAVAEGSPQFAEQTLGQFVQRNIRNLVQAQQNAIFHTDTQTFVKRAKGALLAQMRPEDNAPATRRRIDYSKGFKAALEQVTPYAFDLLDRTTKATRRKANDEAAALAKVLHEEDRLPTAAEREVLSKWSGQGGVSGSINAFYTPTRLAASMWGLLHTHGFTGGRVLEPSIGGGVFAETAPESAQMTGVELNPTTVSVVSKLQPDTRIVSGAMETYNTSSDDDLFDAVIGNPPYGARGDNVDGTLVSTRNLDKPHMARNEEYFIDTSLDRVKPGGLVAVLVNSGLIQNGNSRSFRAHMLARADVVTVVRAPLSTFEDSGAAVTPDVILLRKRPEGVGEALAALVARHGEDALKAAGVYREDVMSGEYIAVGDVDDDSGMTVGYKPGLHPDHALGDIGGNLRAHHGGYQVAVRGTLDDKALTKLAEMPEDEMPKGPGDLQALLYRLHAAGMDEASVGTAEAVGKSDHYPIPEGAISEDGSLIFRNHRWHRIEENDLPHVKAFVGISRDVREFNRLKAQGSSHGAEALRQSLLEDLKAFQAAHGDPHANTDIEQAAQRLPYLRYALAALQGGTLNEPVHVPRLPDDVDSSDPHAVARALAGQGRLTPEALSDHHGMSREDARQLLLDSPDFAYNGSRWQTAQDYYWGDAYQQADNARAMAENEGDRDLAAKLRAQAQRFLSLVEPKSLDEMDFSARDKWVPLDAVEAWVNDYLDAYEREYTTDPVTGEHTIRKLPLIRLKYSEGVYSALPVRENTNRNHNALTYLKEDQVQPLLNYLNRNIKAKQVSDKKNMTAEQYEKERADNVRAARDFENSLKDSFKTFVYSTDHAATVEAEYNRAVASYIAPPDLNDPFPIEGWNLAGGTPHPFQYATVRKAVAQGSSYIALDVGLGKTFVGLMLAAKLKQEGKAKKPTVTCPASMLTEWANEAERMLPGKKVLVLGVHKNKKGGWTVDSAAEKKAKLARMASEEFDLVIMNHELFEAIPMRRETREELLMADFERERLQSLKGKATKFNKKGEIKSDAVKDMAGFTSSNLSKVKIGSENDICFEDLGIDALVADEAHEYKNLYAAPKEYGEPVKFLGGGAESNQAMEFQHKTKYIRRGNGDGRGIFCMSATPTKNSPLEIYYALQFVTDDLEKRGIPSVTDFMDRYCIKDQVIVPGKDGNLKPFQGIVGFKNLDELRGIMDRYLIRETARTALMKDRATGELVTGMKLPDREDVEQFFDMSPEAQSLFESLKAEAKAAKSDKGGDQHLFAVYDRMRKLTLDPALHGISDGPNPRFVKAAEIAADSLKNGGKVIMFMDSAEALAPNIDPTEDEGEDDTDAGEGSGYDRLVQQLVARGIPAEQIKVVTGKTASKAERAQIAADFREGKYRVVIGNKVMEQGMNLQKGTTDMIHLTTPWDPGSYWQRLGRAIRQGNTQEKVRNHVLLARGSFDQFTYSALMGKKGWTDVLWDPKSHGGANGAAMQALDELQLAFSDDKDAETARLAAQRDQIRAEQHAQMVKSTGGLLQTYFQTRAARATREEEAQGRKKGPTPTDKAALARLDATLRKLQTTIHGTADYPFAALTHHDGPVYIGKSGVPYHRGMTFKMVVKGQVVDATVTGVKPENGTVFVRTPGGELATWLHPDDLQGAHGWEVSPELGKLHADALSEATLAKADSLTALYRRMLA